MADNKKNRKKQVDLKRKITPEIILKAVTENTDFGFEMQCVSLVKEMGWDYSHGGTYIDPVRGYYREFDIRCRFQLPHLQHETPILIKIALECKNLDISNPAVILTSPSTGKEDYLSFLITEKPPPELKIIARGLTAPYAAKLFGDFPVGKSIVRVSEKGISNRSDSEALYNKWSQAVSSAHSWALDSLYDWKTTNENKCATIFFPALVVPDYALWKVEYGYDGKVINNPSCTDLITYYIDHLVDYKTTPQLTISIPRLFIMTYSGLKDFRNMFSGDLNLLNMH